MAMSRLQSVLSGKFQLDLIWNFISLGFMGVSGILLNILIALFYRPSDLGIFNQAYAIYIFASQLAVIGLPPSVLKHVAEHTDEKVICGAIISSAFFLTMVNGLVVAVCLWLSRHFIGNLFSSEELSISLAWVSPGLIFFGINKVFLSAFNGFRRMRLFAVMQSLRFLLMIVVFLFLVFGGWRGDSLAVLFSIAEILLFFICMFFIGGFLFSARMHAMKPWFTKHLKFGIKSSFSGILLELNTRVDVLMLGYFASDTLVGIYSFSAILAEGFFQVAMVVTRNVTPILVRKIVKKEFEELRAFIKKGKKLSLIFMVAVGGLLIISYPFWIKLITNRPEYHGGWLVFSILVTGTIAASGYLPFRQILLAAGLPGWHSIMIMILVGMNVLLNNILIPSLDMTGAALATAMAMASLVPLLKVFVRCKLHVEYEGESLPLL
jgi:O-antigen/teichoic acid export membrane protein